MTAVGVDAGTTTIKVVGYGADGGELVVSRRPTQVARPRPGWAEQDMDGVWAAVADALREVVAQLPAPPDLVAVTAQGDGAWLVDDAGRPTGPAVLWNDGRAHDVVTRWEREGVTDEAFQICGSRMSTGLASAVLRWFRDHDSDRLARSERLLTCGGWLFLRLTGEAVTDLSDASAPFLDLRRGEWSDRLLKLYDLESLRRLLPDLRDDDHRVTPLSRAAARETGLPEGVPVVMAPYDICSTAIGAGAVRPGEACCILGTTLSAEVVTDTVVTEEPVGITIALGVPGRYLRAFPTMSGGDVLEWARRLLGVSTVAELTALAAGGRPGTAGVRFLPYLSPAGERAPFLEPSARGSITGLSFDATREDVARAVLEGLTMTIRDCLAAAPGTPDRLALCGGWAGSGLWRQLIADVTNLPVAVSADAEVGARGAWLAALVATGRESSFEAATTRYLDVSAACEPDPSASAAYDRLYEEFVGLRELHRPVWAAAGRDAEPAGGGEA